jgi:hypothetical protein
VLARQPAEGAPIIVVRNGGVVGLLTAETIGEFILMQGARQASTRRRAN